MSDPNPYTSDLGGSHAEGPAETWAVSYSDLMTLLMVFFVLMISSSKMSAVHYDKIKSAMEGKPVTENAIEKVNAQIQQKIQEKKIQDSVGVQDHGDSIEVIFKDRMLFDSGKTDIKPESLPMVQEIIKIFEGLPPYARIAIEGYTDDNPVNPVNYRSNWHLSAMRALSVLEELERNKICNGNCELRGFGEYHEYKPNRDKDGKPIEENQSQNRRVVIRIF